MIQRPQNVAPSPTEGRRPTEPSCKLLEDMRKNPAGDWQIKDVETVCEQTGLICKPPRRGSHYKVISKHVDGILTIPHNKPIKSPYIKHLVHMADAHRRLAEGE